MKTAVFSSKSFEQTAFSQKNLAYNHDLTYFAAHLDARTAILAKGFSAVCAFVSDRLDALTLNELSKLGVKLIALRSAGFNHVDLRVAQTLGLPVVRVPAYPPHAIAEHAVALMLSLNRKIHKAYNRVREGNFSLDGLVGFDLHQKTVGVVGTGLIGSAMVGILRGFGCRVVACDPIPNPALVQLGILYVSMDELMSCADVITLHCPLNSNTRHLVNQERLAKAKRGVMIINTGRGALIDTRAAIDGLKLGQIGYLGLDVYEEEESLFFEDHSAEILGDDVFARLLTFPNVLITGHQAFLTNEALGRICETTLQNLSVFEDTGKVPNAVNVDPAKL